MSHNLNQDCWEKFKKLRYVDDNILRTESEEELKSLLMRMREKHGKAGLKFNVKKTITSWQREAEKMETVVDFTFLDSKTTADSDCSHEIKRCSLSGKKAMTNLDIILRRRDITLPTKVHRVKAIIFPVVMYRCELDHKEGWVPKNWCFELWWWRRLLKESLGQTSQSQNKPTLNIHWKDYCWSWSSILWPPDAKSQLTDWERLKAREENDRV